MAAKKRRAGSSRNPLVPSTESIGRPEPNASAAPKREAKNIVPAGVAEAIAAVRRTLQAAGFGAVEEYLLQEFRPFGYDHGNLETKAARFRNQLDLLDREMRDSPELRQIFQDHAILTGVTQAPQTVPDFPSERYKNRPAGEDIFGFLRRVWVPYLYYGFANADDIKAVDADAFKAIPWPKARYKPRQNLEQFLNEHWKSLIEIDLATRVFINSYDELLGIAIANRLKGGRCIELQPATLKILNSRALEAKAIPPRHAARISGTQASRLRRSSRSPR